ncbi:MAG: hypothetical protein GEU82_11280 [Luteitalea sp.]|nr:hypothetical protein [Luteitalea sp.]
MKPLPRFSNALRAARKVRRWSRNDSGIRFKSIVWTFERSAAPPSAGASSAEIGIVAGSSVSVSTFDQSTTSVGRIALVLKPNFHDTFAFSIGRVSGTVLGAAGATAVAYLFAPGPVALIVLVLGFVWGAYGFAMANYAAVSICITGYVVFLMTLAGIPEATAATDRIIYTAIAGVLALCLRRMADVDRD